MAREEGVQLSGSTRIRARGLDSPRSRGFVALIGGVGKMPTRPQSERRAVRFLI